MAVFFIDTVGGIYDNRMIGGDSMIEWEEKIPLTVPFTIAKERITILQMSYFFEEITSTKRIISDAFEEQYQQSATYMDKNLSYTISVIERNSTPTVEEFIFAIQLKEQVSIHCGIRIEQVGEELFLTYSGIVKPLKKSFALSAVLLSSKKQIFQKIVKYPLRMFSELSLR